jgi:hypothetical protein
VLNWYAQAHAGMQQRVEALGDLTREQPTSKFLRTLAKMVAVHHQYTALIESEVAKIPAPLSPKGLKKAGDLARRQQLLDGQFVNAVRQVAVSSGSSFADRARQLIGDAL